MSDHLPEKTIELSSKFDIDVADVENDRPPHVVIALHGIRDDSSWSYELIPHASPFEDKVIVAPVSYGRLNRFSFILNLFIKRIDKRVINRMNKVYNLHKSSPISIMCHSNGTKILSRVISKLEFEPEYVFLVGSVCHLNDCDNLLARRRVINECGVNDIYPIFAETIRPYLFGATGVFGFNNYPIIDRQFSYKHSNALSRKHFEEWILPILTTGKVRKTAYLKPKYSKHFSHYTRMGILISITLLVSLYYFS